MLIWVCAMRCEAKPVIDYYRLQKYEDRSLPFGLYQSADKYCIISGIGRHNTADTLTQAQASLQLSGPTHWINLGIAGHKSLAVGSLRVIKQAADARQNDVIKLQQAPDTALKTASIISVNNETTHYPDSAIIDMEAYHFASHCQSAEQIHSFHCLKVISDNAASQPTRNKARISALITDNMAQITDFARHLEDTSQ